MGGIQHILSRGTSHADNYLSSDVFRTNLLKNTVCKLYHEHVDYRNKVQFFFFTLPLWLLTFNSEPQVEFLHPIKQTTTVMWNHYGAVPKL